jgi:multidrug resistance efflux pump
MSEAAGAGTISKQELVDARERYSVARAMLTQAEASREQANAVYAGSQDAIVLAEEKLKTAEFSLTQCIVVAPANGFVTN